MPSLEENVLENLSAREIVLGVISLKQDKAPIHFKEEALEYGFRRAANDFSSLRRLFEPTCDGTSPEHSTSFGNVIMIFGYDGGPIMQLTGDWQLMYMTQYGQEVVQRELVKDNGPGALEGLKPVARKVWTYAREYSQ